MPNFEKLSALFSSNDTLNGLFEYLVRQFKISNALLIIEQNSEVPSISLKRSSPND